jgi:hypothetical protein
MTGMPNEIISHKVLTTKRSVDRSRRRWTDEPGKGCELYF